MRSLSLALAAATVSASHIDLTFGQQIQSRSLNTTNGNITSPNSDGGILWKDAHARAKKIVAQLTVEEKVGLVTGQVGRCAGNLKPVERLGIGDICAQDGPAGVRPTTGVTQFPAGVTIAATWNRDLMYKRGKYMGQEFYDMGVGIALSPVTGGPLGRSPWEGRNWEGFYSDPYGTGVAAYETVTGMRSSGVLTTAKHWIGNEQETYRNLFNATASYSVFPASGQLPISANIDDRAIHELYMWGFAEAIRAGTDYVMCSYNEVNNTHSCSNSYSLNGLLKTELNFQGAIMSDWGAVWSDENAQFVLGGCDIVMPGYNYGGSLGSFWGNVLVEQVNNGTVPQERIDDMVIRTLTPWYASGQGDKAVPQVPFNAVDNPGFPVSYRNVQKSDTPDLVKQIGLEAHALLKNQGGLPLKKGIQSIAVIGNDAGSNFLGPRGCGPFNDACPITNPNGTMSIGGGSGAVWPHNLITPLSAIQSYAQQTNTYVEYTLNNTNLDRVTATAASGDVALVFVNAYAAEGQDRENLDLSDNGDAIIKAATAGNNNTVVILHIPGPVLLEEWIENDNITAVLCSFLPGEQSGNSLIPILFGDVSPSGKLPFTLGKSVDDWPPNTIVKDPVYAPQADFTESLKIDYRWFDSKGIEPRYEFGYGLSYSSFSYSNIKLQKTYKRDQKALQRTAEPFVGADGYKSLYDIIAVVSASVTNTGKYTASEVAQLYVEFPESVGEPPRVLRGFDKLQNLSPGSSQTASFEITIKDVSIWNVVKQAWEIPDGTITFHVGASSRNLPLKTSTAF
ncbi:glycoside hydrolase family 3 protein [Atractiella rhizophila]|nr:glycoside hydrolase family 3 protein [Atractiella rhizophila]